MKFILFFSMLLTSFIVNAQTNMLKDDAGNFEGEASGWWRFQKENIKFIKGKSSKGSFSLKFQRKPGEGELGNLQASSTEALKAPLKYGKYKIELNVFLGKKAPAGFNVNFVENKKFIPVGFTLKGLKKGKWITVSEEVEFKSKRPFNGKIVLAMLKNEKFGGNGVVYIDDLKITRIK